MKIIIVNGSHRKNGATAQILQEIYEQLKKYPNVDVQLNRLFCERVHNMME